MKHLKKYKLFEYNQFPTSNLEIENLCELHEINNYTINSDGTVDVDGDLFLTFHKLDKLPVRFGTVTGTFDCSFNHLASLEGCPKVVGGDFYCHDNNLTSLKGGPEKVGGLYKASINDLTTLEGCPDEIYDSFMCYANKLKDLKTAPKKIEGGLICYTNNIYEIGLENGEFSWDYIEFIDEYAAINDPDSKWEPDDFNPIATIVGLFESQEDFLQSLDHHYFKGGNKIDKRRFFRALEEFGIEAPETLTGYLWV